MKPNSVVIFLLLCPISLWGQEINNTSYVSSVGEKVLRLEFVIPVDKHEAWNLFTTADGWKKWATPVVSMDFRVGGYILTNYDKNKTVHDSGTIRLPILNYLEREMITLKVILNNEAFPQKVRQEDANLQEIIQFIDLGKGKTKIISSMIGWGVGQDWDKIYRFFAEGNEWTYRQLIKLFK